MMSKTKDTEEVHIVTDLEAQGLAMVAWQIYWAGHSTIAKPLDEELVEKARKYLHQLLDSKLRVTH